MKILPILILFLTVHVISLKGQKKISYSYSPDSTSLSILFDDLKLDKNNKAVTIDLKGRWKKLNFDSINIDLRGDFVTQESTKSKKQQFIKVRLFGKMYKIKIDSKKSFIWSEKLHISYLIRKPEISFCFKPRTKDEFFNIDSVDLHSGNN